MSAVAGTGPQLFSRYCKVQVDTVSSAGLRVTFEITRTSTKEPNKASVAVYNLAATTRQRMKSQDVFVSIDAGYVNQHSTIFQGWVRTIEHLRDATEWITRTRGGDGEKQIRQQRVSQSWKAGTPYSLILNQLATATGLNTGNVPSVAAAGVWGRSKVGQTLQRSFVAQGSAYDELAQLAFSLGFNLSVQDGALMLVPFGSAVVKPAVLLSPQTGLHGSPEAGEKGIIKAVSSLSGSFFPGRQVQLQSSSYNGFFSVYKVVHKGDTHGTAPESWISTLELKPIAVTPRVSAP